MVRQTRSTDADLSRFQHMIEIHECMQMIFAVERKGEKMVELKPCPFCGSEPQSGVEFYESCSGSIKLAATVYCPKCHIVRRNVFKATDINPVPFFDYEVAFDKVKKLWNRRVKDEVN